MSSVSRRWLQLVKITGILVVILLAAGMFTLRTAAAQWNDNTTHETDQVDVRQFRITIEADGKRIPCLVGGKVTVEEQLDKLDLSLEQMDTVTPAADAVLKDDDVIKVSRKRYETVVERGVVPFETVYTYSPEVRAGEETVFTQGEDGYGERTYQLLMVDGVEQERTLVKERLEKEPVTKHIGTGFRSPLISPFDFDWTFDENGEPLECKNILRSQRSSAYSAPNGAKTASGRDAIVGHVAVNPKVIPYGSKLFIQSRDGKYIYGYAVAADTGLALMDGRVGVDIFYNTYQESVNHGIKAVDIFVLE